MPVDEVYRSSPGIEIGFALDVSRGIGDHRCSFQVIGEIIEDSICALPRDALAVKENIFIGQISAQVTFAYDPRRVVIRTTGMRAEMAHPKSLRYSRIHSPCSRFSRLNVRP
jgi:hypothetical protein